MKRVGGFFLAVATALGVWIVTHLDSIDGMDLLIMWLFLLTGAALTTGKENP